jgi:hypothetical protein
MIQYTGHDQMQFCICNNDSKLHNEELHNLYSSPSIINVQAKKDAMSGACSTNGGEEECI